MTGPQPAHERAAPVRPGRLRRRAGMTLLELVISTSVMIVILGGLSGAVVIASNAAQAEGDPDSAAIDAASVLETMLTELALAKTVSYAEPDGVTFTVADRDADSADETIAYRWAGAPGDPLTRQYNSNTPRTVLESVETFSLDFVETSVTETATRLTRIETNQRVVGESTSVSVNENRDITSTSGVSQPIVLSLPADAIAWRPTSVTLILKTAGTASGQIAVEFRSASSNSWSPTDRVLASITVSEADLPGSYSATTYAIADASWVAPSQRTCVIIRDIAGTTSANAALTTELDLLGLLGSPELRYWYGGPNAGTWTQSQSLLGLSPAVMPLWVRAEIRRPASDQTSTTNLITAVEAELTASGRTLRSAAPLHNAPEAP